MKIIFSRIVSIISLAVCCTVGAVEYSLPDLNGQLQPLNQYRDKWVIVNYWATWCGTCRKELPELIALHEKHAQKDIVVIGINFESISQRELSAFVTDMAIPYPVLRSEPIPKTPLGPVPALPTTYIIDPQGKLVAGEVGIVTMQNLEDYISEKSFSGSK